MTVQPTIETPAPLVPEPVPFHVPTIDDGDIAAVVDVMRSGWLTTGPRCAEFERGFGEFLGGGLHCIAVNSCTAALHLALEAVGIGPGDRVLTTPLTFTATAEVVRYLGAHPVFADIDPATGNLTVQTVRAALDAMSPQDRASVKALVPVHFAGLPADMTGLAALAEEQGWALVDDAAHALPAAHRGRPVGRLADITAFSFYSTKTLCTGEGGMAVTADAELAARMRRMRLHGIDRDVFDRYQNANAWYYEVVAPGFKYNMTDLAAAIGSSQLRRVVGFRDERRAIADAYDARLSGVEGLLRPARATTPGDEHAHHLYTLRVLDGPEVRSELIRQLAAERIGTSVHFVPLHVQPYYRDAYGLAPSDFPEALRFAEREISLPIFPGMTGDQVARVGDAVERLLPVARATAG